jgi:voltage-gated potassium channel
MNKKFRKFFTNKMFSYGKFLMTSPRIRLFFITASCVAVIIAIMETSKPLFLEYEEEFYKANSLFAGIFTIEFILRFLSFERGKLGKRKFGKLNYILKPTTIIDIATIVPFYLYFFYPFNILFKTLRIFRILNLVQFSKFDRLLNKIFRFIKQRKTAIVATLLIAAIFILIIATLMYLVEREAQPSNFGSVYDSLWWCIVTVTAVGYGDVIPVTALGKIIGSITCFSGVLFIVIPVSIFSSELANIKCSKKKHKLLRAGKKWQ